MKKDMNCSRFLHTICLLAIFTVQLIAENHSVQFSAKSKNMLLITVDFSSFSDDILYSMQEKNDQHLPRPIIPESILLLSGSERLDIQIEEIETQEIDQNINFVEDISIGLDDEISIQNNSISPLSFRTTQIGKIGSQFVHRVQVYPVFKNNTPRSTIIQKIRLSVSGQSILQVQNPVLSSKAFISTNKSNSAQALNKISQSQSYSGSQDRLKIMIPKDGIYVIPQPMIQEAGFDLKGIDPHYLRVINRKKEIPIRILGEDDGALDYTDVIEFWGEALWDTKKSDKRLDIYSYQNVYWLEVGDKPGLRMGQVEGRIPDDNPQDRIYSNSFPYTQHVEQDAYFHRLAYAQNVDDADHWFYSNPIVGDEKRDFGFHIVHPDLYSTQLAKMKFRLQGQVRDEKIHPFEIYINNRAIGKGTWTGIQSIVLESKYFSPSFLKEGYNIVTIINRSAEGELCQLILDWFELTYPRLYKPLDNIIHFQAPNYSLGKVVAFEIEDFKKTPIEIYKNGSIRIFNPEIIPFTDTLNVTTYEIRFQDKISDESVQYVALTPDRKMVPDSVAFVEANDLRSTEKGADYIMITASDSLGEESLMDLIELRESQGYSVETVLLHHIYYEFSDGIPNPAGIQNFLHYAKSNWNPSPRFVLLVGDGMINNRVSQSQGNHIPIPLFQTIQFGASASDHWYSLLDDDIYPDIAIGRLPIRTIDELQLVISKIINYETAPRASWMNQYLLIGAGGYGDVFKFQSEEIIEQIFNPRYEPKRLYLFGDISDPDVGGTEDLLRYFRDGMAMVNFRGHGGGAIWSDGGLLDMDDIELIENKERLPIITSMTCFTADFSSSKQSIGEALLYQEEGGAGAFWGSTGLGWVWNDYYLLQNLYQILNANTVSTIGEMIMHAKRNYLMTYGGDLPLSEAHQYVLLGDPALSVHLPDKNTKMELSRQSLNMSETFIVEGELLSPQANVQLEVVNSKGYSFDEKTIASSNPNWQTSLTIPDDFRGEKGGIRSYAWDPESRFHSSGFVPFQIGLAFFSEEQTIPENPTSRDSVRFSVKIEDQHSTVSVWCRLIEPVADSLAMMMAPDSSSFITEIAAGPFEPGIGLAYSFATQNSEGTISTGDTIRYRVPLLSDVIPIFIQLGGVEQVQIEATILNGGEESIQGIPVIFEDPDGIIGTDTVDVSSYGQVNAKTDYFPPSMGEIPITIRANPDSTVAEKSMANNEYTASIQIHNFNVTPEFGTMSGQSQSSSVGIPGELICTIQPQTLNTQSVLKIEKYHLESPWFSGITIQNPEYTYFIQLSNMNKELILPRHANVQFYFRPENGEAVLKPYRWEENLNNWIVCNYTMSDSVISIQTNRFGAFTLLNSNDTQPPQIQFQVNDQSLTNGSYVPQNPSISLVIQDESGVDIREESIKIFLNDQNVDPSQLIIPDSIKEVQHVSIIYRPQITIGDYRIYAIVQDIHGNTGQSNLTWFQVSSEFDIQFLGNHPNPFDKETVFVYVLTDAAEYLSLKIYTVSGRLIKTFDDYSLAAADYHEVVWDGTDDWGEKVSNGVYFFRLLARNHGKSREVTGKVAIIR